jgi:hypothetical protein
MPVDLGADTRQILRDIGGLTDEKISELMAAKVIYGPEAG